MKEVIELLKQMEWSNHNGAGGKCAYCHRTQVRGHDANCKLRRALALLRQQPEAGDIYKGLLSTPAAIVAGEEHIIIDRQATKLKQLKGKLLKQSEAGEFTKELRKICAEEQKEERPFIAIEIVEEACDLLDCQTEQLNYQAGALRQAVKENKQLAGEIKELKAKLAGEPNGNL
jgi:hypothetical protein